MKKTTANRFDGMVVGLFFLVYTLLVHARVLPTLPIEEEIYGLQSITELFHQFKSQVLVVVAVALLIALLMSILTGEIRVRGDGLFLVCIGGYASLSIASYVLSVHKDLAWRGGIDRHEGLPVLLAYAMIAVFFYYATNENRASIWYLRLFTLNNVLIYLMGLFQTAGYNLLNQEWFLKLIIWPAQDVVVESVGLSATRAAYATFGNQNFMGSYAILSIPFNLYMVYRANSRKETILWGSLATLGLSTLLCSYSMAGMVGFFVVLPVLSVYGAYTQQKVAKLKVLLPIALMPIGVYFSIAPSQDAMLIAVYMGAWLLATAAQFFSALVVRKNIIVSYRSVTMATASVALISVILVVGLVTRAPRLTLPLSELTVEGQNATVVVYGERLRISYSDSVLTIEQESNDRAYTLHPSDKQSITSSSGRVIETQFFKDAKTEGLYGFAIKEPYLVFMMGTFNGNELFTLVGNGSRAIEPEYPMTIGILDGLERIGSGRGYILSRSLALIPDNLIVGSGPDNYVAVFPQRDVTGKSAIANPYLIIDKPHNWYLQMAINTGLVSSLCIIGVIMLLIHKALKSFFLLSLKAETAVVLTLACVGYAVTGLFNDSVVSVAPVFWAMLGSAHGLYDRAK